MDVFNFKEVGLFTVLILKGLWYLMMFLGGCGAVGLVE